MNKPKTLGELKKSGYKPLQYKMKYPKISVIKSVKERTALKD